MTEHLVDYASVPGGTSTKAQSLTEQSSSEVKIEDRKEDRFVFTYNYDAR